jgi:thiamine biosynthesis lipoprotein
MYASGKNPDGESWGVSIEGIPEEDLMLDVTDLSVATSGRTRRFWEKDGKMYHHIVDPTNPSVFSFELQTVTVVSDSSVRSDAWAKALFLKGIEKGLRYADEKNIAAVFLDDRGHYLLSKDMQRYVHRN